jgi:hypothetical protein
VGGGDRRRGGGRRGWSGCLETFLRSIKEVLGKNCASWLLQLVDVLKAIDLRRFDQSQEIRRDI